MTLQQNKLYPEIRKYLEIQSRITTPRGTGLLCIVAARAKVSEGDLHDIVDGGPISDEIAAAVANIIE
jgi:hypothetical protein